MTPPAGLLISDDLIFTSRITATARAVGVSVAPVRSMALALAKARESSPPAVIVDLHNPGLDIAGLMAGLREACSAMPRVIAYGSHVDVETLRVARGAGCDRVMPRSQFVQELEPGLRAWFS